jgi:hypothetical protein
MALYRKATADSDKTVSSVAYREIYESVRGGDLSFVDAWPFIKLAEARGVSLDHS